MYARVAGRLAPGIVKNWHRFCLEAREACASSLWCIGDSGRFVGSVDGVVGSLGKAGALQEPDTALRLEPGSYFWGKST